MNIPQNRKEDIRWLDRNITFTNKDHRYLKESKKIIKYLLEETGGI